MIGVAVPKYVYNSWPLKHEVVNLLMSGEMLYHEDPNQFSFMIRAIWEAQEAMNDNIKKAMLVSALYDHVLT